MLGVLHSQTFPAKLCAMFTQTIFTCKWSRRRKIVQKHWNFADILFLSNCEKIFVEPKCIPDFVSLSIYVIVLMENFIVFHTSKAYMRRGDYPPSVKKFLLSKKDQNFYFFSISLADEHFVLLISTSSPLPSPSGFVNSAHIWFKMRNCIYKTERTR